MAKPDTAQSDTKNAAKAPSPFIVLRPVAADSVVPAQTVVEGTEPKPLGDLFEKVGEYTSKTSKGAIALAIGEHGGGEYIAVPTRSFVSRKATPVAAPRVKWD